MLDFTINELAFVAPFSGILLFAGVMWVSAQMLKLARQS